MCRDFVKLKPEDVLEKPAGSGARAAKDAEKRGRVKDGEYHPPCGPVDLGRVASVKAGETWSSFT